MYCLLSSISFFKTFNQSLILYRYTRNASQRGAVLKTLKDIKVKNIANTDYSMGADDYTEYVKRIRQNDLEVEEFFTKGEDYETCVSESSRLHDIHERERKYHKSRVKKQLIGRKYFKCEKETNLLTHAAKEQIRYLHKLDPTEWAPEILAQSFPISVPGVKKLLKSNFVLTTPEKIKEHDDDVMNKWNVLKSGNSSDFISSYTQKLWNDGKLSRQNYKGNPNLPKASADKPPKLIKERRKKAVGEFSAIVQKYVLYKSGREFSKNNQSEFSTKSEIDSMKHLSKHLKHDSSTPNLIKKSKLFGEKGNNFEGKGKNFDDTEFPLSQFKENLGDEFKFQKSKSASDMDYQEWMKENSEKKDFGNLKNTFNAEEFFSEIPKYNKDSIEITQDAYNNTLGYEFRKEKSIERKFQVPVSSQKNNVKYKVGRCIYDKDGELLYKLPD